MTPLKNALLSISLATALFAQSLSAQTPPKIEVYFSPDGGCADAIVNAIEHATNSIVVQAYSFTSAPIAQALVDAHRRRVKVQVILDDSQVTAQYSSATFLANSGLRPLIDSKHKIAHNKVMVIDRHTVITGSFNFTAAAEKDNAENLLLIHDSQLAAKYLANWQEHAKHSANYTGPRKPKR